MKVTLSVSGGFAAMMPRPDRVLDTEKNVKKLAKPDAERLRTLATSVIAGAGGGSAAGNPRVRDGQTYELTIEDDAGKESTVVRTDGSMTPEFSELMQFVKKHA